MDVRAQLRFARISPRKARLVAQTIRGVTVEVAEVRLRLLRQRAAPLLAKLLQSAVANARHNFSLNPHALKVSLVSVNEGPRLKRYVPRARGVANRVIKRTSHIEIVVSDVGSRMGPEARSGEHPRIETKRAEELSAEELKSASRPVRRDHAPGPGGTTKPVEAPRGIRRLLERRHGGGE